MSKILARVLENSVETTVIGTIKTSAEVETRRNNKQNNTVILMMYEVLLDNGETINVVEKRNSAEKANLKAKYYTAGKKVEVSGTMMTWYYPELAATYTNLYGYGRLV